MALDPKPIPPNGARLLPVSGQEANFFIYEVLSKNPAAGEYAPYETFGEVVSLGIVTTATDGTKWLRIDAFFEHNPETRYPDVNYVSYDDRDIIWVDLPTPLIPIPNTPINLAVSAVSPTELYVIWGGAGGTVVEVERTDNPTFLPQKVYSSAINTTGYHDKNLSPNTEYFYRIRAINETGGSPYTELYGIRTPAIPPTPTPVPDSTPSPAPAPVVAPIGSAQLASLQVLSNLPASPVAPASWLEANLNLVLIGIGLIMVAVFVVIANRNEDEDESDE